MPKVFDNATNLITFARGSSATYTDSDGTQQTAASDEPRIDYAANGSLKGLLIEEQRTNLLLNSGNPNTQVVTLPAGSHTLSFVGGPSVTGISDTITANAVDVFIYDTSKDSDGGAWRTGSLAQASSWYNETLNTSTRGSRKEFPAVAVIVAEASKVTIYDGDDPSLPMWMVFEAGSGANKYLPESDNYPVSSVYALNGFISVGQAGTYGGCATLRFLADAAVRYRAIGSSNTTQGTSIGPISERNSSGYDDSQVQGTLVNEGVNDVAMTVLPDAPTDPATGLPVPTIAVATDGGVSVIKDDGTVVDSAATFKMGTVDFNDDNGLWYSRFQASHLLWYATSSDYQAGDGFGDVVADDYDNNYSFPLLTRTNRVAVASEIYIGGSSGDIGYVVNGLMLHQPNYVDQSKGMSALLTSTYTTGWMNGDIKLAALADTTAETLSGSELVTNNEFTTDTVWTDRIGASSGGTVEITGGELVITQGSNSVWMGATQGIDVTGVDYIVIEAELVSRSTGGAVRVGLHTVDTAPATPNLGYMALTEGSNTVTLDVSGSSGTVYLVVMDGQGAGANSHVDNIKVRLADPDRSVNGKGLAVYGSITKAPVATGADVVAYYLNGHYLEQPYNPDLDFGTGDFCVMGWANTTDTYATFVRLADSAGGNPKIFVGTYPSPTAGNLDAYILGTSVLRPNVLTPTGWFHWALVRTNGQATLYANSVPLVSVASTTDLSLTGTETLRVGVRHDGQQTLDAGSLALLRISATAPTADQIAKIYNDEKVLFQENAKATLTGNSDAVTALAHDPDTDLLHVGTSGGRSVFYGLRRVNETATPVTTAISAVDGLIVEQ